MALSAVGFTKWNMGYTKKMAIQKIMTPAVIGLFSTKKSINAIAAATQKRTTASLSLGDHSKIRMKAFPTLSGKTPRVTPAQSYGIIPDFAE
jgi:hypothetical protein